jgi:hypothetical protein
VSPDNGIIPGSVTKPYKISVATLAQLQIDAERRACNTSKLMLTLLTATGGLIVVDAAGVSVLTAAGAVKAIKTMDKIRKLSSPTIDAILGCS